MGNKFKAQPLERNERMQTQTIRIWNNKLRKFGLPLIPDDSPPLPKTLEEFLAGKVHEVLAGKVKIEKQTAKYWREIGHEPESE